MTDKAKTTFGSISQAVSFVVSIATLLFLAGVWKGNADAGQLATASEVKQLTAQIEALKQEVSRYADENRALHAGLSEQFVTRREWLLLLNHAQPKAVIP